MKSPRTSSLRHEPRARLIGADDLGLVQVETQQATQITGHTDNLTRGGHPDRAKADTLAGYPANMPNVHIIPAGERWNAKQENGDLISTHDTQAEAEQAAKNWARQNGGGEVFTHRDEGEFSRIRKGEAV